LNGLRILLNIFSQLVTTTLQRVVSCISSWIEWWRIKS